MPIYEYACSKCRVVFNFLYRRPQVDRPPKCPRCGNRKMTREMSVFAVSSGSGPRAQSDSDEAGGPMPDLDDPRVERAMSELERDMGQLDESNPRHLAHIMRKMKDLLPPGAAPRELDVAIKRLEAGEDPEKIEEDMGDVFGELGGPPGTGGAGAYAHDDGLYDGD
jgi:putative FmdB family regulatory protein